MKLQLLPSSFDNGGAVSQRQHLSCLIIDDCVAFDAGSLAFSCSERHRSDVRDIFISHTHLDHIAGLPIFVDDLFSVLSEPIRVHATVEMIRVLERDIFNWSIYPKFSELENSVGRVIEYKLFEPESTFPIRHLTFQAFQVNHHEPSVGALVTDGEVSIGVTGDTAPTELIWDAFRNCESLQAVLVECAFPNELASLAEVSHHLTPLSLSLELEKFGRRDVPIYVMNIKPMYMDDVLDQLNDLRIPNLFTLKIGSDYEF